MQDRRRVGSHVSRLLLPHPDEQTRGSGYGLTKDGCSNSIVVQPGNIQFKGLTQTLNSQLRRTHHSRTIQMPGPISLFLTVHSLHRKSHASQITGRGRKDRTFPGKKTILEDTTVDHCWAQHSKQKKKSVNTNSNSQKKNIDAEMKTAPATYRQESLLATKSFLSRGFALGERRQANACPQKKTHSTKHRRFRVHRKV